MGCICAMCGVTKEWIGKAESDDVDDYGNVEFLLFRQTGVSIFDALDHLREQAPSFDTETYSCYFFSRTYNATVLADVLVRVHFHSPMVKSARKS